MSSFQHLATPAIPSEAALAEPAKQVGPAVMVDDPRKFAPPTTKEETAHLSAAALRGAGSDFESRAAVLRGAPTKNVLQKYLPLFFYERDFITFGEVDRFVFVKGNCCFIYGQATDPAPLYAIPLEDVMAIQENPEKLDKTSVTISPKVNTNAARDNLVTILFKYRENGKQAYQITFDTSEDKSVAKRFLDVIAHNGKLTQNNTVTASVLHAKAVGGNAAKLQPNTATHY
jgi:hypothetical protein